MEENNMAIHNERINHFVDPKGPNFATGNKMKLIKEPTKKDLKTENPPTTLEILQMEKEKRDLLTVKNIVRLTNQFTQDIQVIRQLSNR